MLYEIVSHTTELIVSKSVPKEYTFYKENDFWYIHLPCFNENQEDLVIDKTASYMLDALSMGRTSFKIICSEYEIKQANYLILVNETPDNGEGALYNHYFYGNPKDALPAWFCNNLKRMFGYYPEKIYYVLN